MPRGVASVKVTGNVTEALAALEALGIKAEATGKEVESKLGGAATRTGGLFSKAGQTLGNWGLPFSESLNKVGDKMKETETKGSSAFRNLASVGKGMALGVAGGFAVIGVESVKAAMSAEVVDAQLRTALTNAGASFAAWKPKIDAADSSMRNLGFTNEQSNSALTTLTRSLGSPAKALGVLSVAANLARQKNIDLNQAALLVAKGMEGQTRPLKQLGIDLPVYAGGAHNVQLAQLALTNAQRSLNQIIAKTPDAINPANKAHQSYENALYKVQLAQTKLHDVQNSGQTILDALKEKVNGAAAAYGDTLAGRVQIAKAQLDNMAERIGAFLIPKITELIGVVERVVAWFQRHKDVAIAVGIAILVLVAGPIAAYIGSMIAAAAATLAATAPIMAIILVVAAVGVAIFELVKHWSQVWGEVKRIAEDVWNGIKHIFEAGVDFVKAHWKDMLEVLLAVVTGGVSIIPTLIYRYWNQITQFTSQLWRDVTGFVSRIWHDVVNFFSQMYQGAVGWAQRLWNDVTGFFRRIVSDAMQPLDQAIQFFGQVWNDIWNGVQTVIQDVWSVIKPIVDAIKTAVSDVGSAISGLGHVAGSVGGAIGKGLSAIGLDLGGWVPAPAGKIAGNVFVHGGEYVLSQAMLAGTQKVDRSVLAALVGSSTGAAGAPAAPTTTASAGGKPGQVNLTVYGVPVDQTQVLANDITWALRPYLAGMP